MEDNEEPKDGVQRPNKPRRKRRKETDSRIQGQEDNEVDGEKVPDENVVAAPSGETLRDAKETATLAAEDGKPKTKKKKKAATEVGAAGTKKKRRKKVERADEECYPPHTILRDVAHLRDDVVEVDSFTPTTPVWHTNVHSQPTGKLFVESGRAFRAMDKQKLMDASNASLPSVRAVDGCARGPVEYGLSSHSWVERLAKYCHGLLAGLALWQCVMVYRLSPPHFPAADFVVHYSPLASAVQAMFYSMTAICMVSLMGSVDLGGGDGAGKKRFLHSGLVALVIYFATLLLSLSIADRDDALALYAHNSTTGMDTLEAGLGAWRNVNLCRCVGAILAWLVLSLFPHEDLTRDHLCTFVGTGAS